MDYFFIADYVYSSFPYNLPLQEGTKENVDELDDTLIVPLKLIPPSPTLKLPCPQAIWGVAHSKGARAGVSSMPSLDVLQEQEGL